MMQEGLRHHRYKLVDKELVHNKGCKRPAKAWKTLNNTSRSKAFGRNKRKMNANIARSSDDFAFVVRDGVSNTAATRWIVDLEASQHMILHTHFFDTYESVSDCKVFMGDNDMVEAVGKGSILVKTHVKGCV